MTAILVLATLGVFLLVGYFYSKKPAVEQAVAGEREVPSVPKLQPALVGKFEVRKNLRYHPGHTWALGESPNFVRVGVDDFATRLIGKADGITIPNQGPWIRQG